MASLQDSNALLIFRVGPVYCCAPTLPVDTIIQPPHLTHPPGSSAAQPGIFKHGGLLVSVVDLRYRFGLDERKYAKPGRMIITRLGQHNIGFWVDGIIDVLETPGKGWGNLPPHLPRGVFSRTLMLDNKIHLYAEFEKLHALQQTGYLRDYIQQLESREVTAKSSAAVQKPDSSKPLHSTSPVQPASGRVHNSPASVQAAAVSPGADKPVTTPYPASTLRHQPSTQQQTTTPLPTATPAVAVSKTDNRITATKQGHQPTTKPTAPPIPPATPRTATRTSTATTARSKTEIRHTNNQQLNSTAIPTNGETATLNNQRTSPVTEEVSAKVQPKTRMSASCSHSGDLRPNISATSRDHSDDNNTESGTTGMLVIMLLLLLLTGGVSYYLLSQVGPQPASIASPAEKTASQLATYTASPEIPETTAETTDNMSDQPATNNIATTDNITETANITWQEKVEPDMTATQATTPVKTSSGTPSGKSNYRASIQQDAEGITIILTEPGITDNDIRQHASHDDYSVGLITKPEPLSVSTITQSNTESETNPAKQNKAETDHHTDGSKKKLRVKTIVHVVVKGDTLWHIAKRYVNNPFLYPELARLSNIKNPDRIYPGNKVRIIQYKK